MNPCAAFFREHAENKERCEALRNVPVDQLLDWEKLRASEYSPGPVEDSEKLCRYWFDIPAHFDDTKGVLAPTAVDDAKLLGMSTNRLGFASVEEICRAASERADRINAARPDAKPRRLIGYSTFAAREARKLQLPAGGRAFCIFDTANADDRSHADVCQLGPTHPKAAAQAARSSRAQLREIMLAGFRTMS